MADEDKWRQAVSKLTSDWEEVRDVLLQSAVETALTAFWVKVPTVTAPAPSDPGGSGTTPGKQTGGGSSDPTPPGVTGQGGPGPTIITHPATAPEPSSVVAALLGAGLVSISAWRRRGRGAV